LRLLSSPEAATPSQSLKIPHGQLLIFTEQLAHLLKAGMTLDEALSVLGKRLKHPRVQQMTHTLHQALIDGRSFSQALSDMPRIFPPLYVNLVAAGEASGALPQILLRLVKHLMQAKDLRDRVQQALIYPAFLALAGAILVTIFITFMVPQLTGSWRKPAAPSIADAHLAARPPCDHRLLVGRRTDTDWWNYRFPRHGSHSGRADRMGPVPVVDPWVRTSDSPPLLRAVCAYAGDFDGKRRAFAARTRSRDRDSGQPFSRSEIRRGAQTVIDGATLSAALQQQKLFPDLFTDMMAVGEQTGHFAETMQAIADVYERELDRSVGVISQLIPPIIIVMIALLVGLVVFSILSAVFEMTHSLQIRPH
jgi:Type II secretory pathway, component PulF